MRDAGEAPTTVQPAAASAMSAEAPRKVLFSAMKNEAPFVLEWIAYHKAIGFDEIVICSNPSNDGMEEILAALAKAGEITHLKAVVEPGQSPQIVASSLFAEACGYQDGNWYLWLDADEFLNIHVGDRTVDSLVSHIGEKHCALINWRVFGTGDNSRFPGRFIDAAFVGASLPDFGENKVVKTLFRYSSAIRYFGKIGMHRPRLSRKPWLRPEDIIVGTGATALPSHWNNRWLKGADFINSCYVTPPEAGWVLAQVNHYVVRTPEFFKLKAQRGRGYKSDSVGEKNRRHTAKFFEQHDRNDTEDHSILFWQDAVTAEIARLSTRPGVAAAVERSSRKVADILNEMDPMPAAPAAVAVPPADFKLTFPKVEAEYLRDRYAAATSILEYGSGGSTVLAASLGKPVIAVESDKAWADRLSAHLATISETARVHYADIGPTGDWGTPLDPGMQDRFHRYFMSVWDRPDLGEPDLVLIDGRFRVACLVAVKMRARRPTTVLFDDFHGRRHYVAVKRLAQKEARVGRMARFTVTPGPIPPDMLTEVNGWFADPR